MKILVTGISWVCGLLAVGFALHTLYVLVTGGGWAPFSTADAFSLVFGSNASTTSTVLIILRGIGQALPALLFFGLIAIGLGNLAGRMKDDET